MSKRIKHVLELHVAPRNGKASREVVVKYGDKEHADVINTAKASARDNFVGRLARDLAITDEGELQEVRTQLVTKSQEADALAEEVAQEAATNLNVNGRETFVQILDSTPKETIDAAKAYLTSTKLIVELVNDFKYLGIAGETCLAVTEYLIGTSRKLEEPLGATVKSSSSSGKSYVTETAVSMFPNEDVKSATDITANALYYMPAGSLVHKLVFVGERKHVGAGHDADSANATMALREMLSRRRLDKFVPRAWATTSKRAR